MDRTTNSLIDNYPTEEEMIKDALLWLIKNKKYRNDVQSGRATTYSGTWVKFVSRCKDYKNRAVLVAWFKELTIDREIVTKIISLLKVEEDESLDYELVAKLFDGHLG